MFDFRSSCLCGSSDFHLRGSSDMKCEFVERLDARLTQFSRAQARMSDDLSPAYPRLVLSSTVGFITMILRPALAPIPSLQNDNGCEVIDALSEDYSIFGTSRLQMSTNDPKFSARTC
jgi:hypothetical protein